MTAQEDRDAGYMSMYEFTADFATLEPPPPEMQQLLLAASESPSARDEFARVTAGVTPPEEFFGHMQERMSHQTPHAA